MTGVAHFERRDRQKFVPEVCAFCPRKIKGTPRSLAGERGHTWVAGWVGHLRDHLLDSQEGPGHIGNIEAALRTAMAVEREYNRNK